MTIDSCSFYFIEKKQNTHFLSSFKCFIDSFVEFGFFKILRVNADPKDFFCKKSQLMNKKICGKPQFLNNKINAIQMSGLIKKRKKWWWWNGSVPIFLSTFWIMFQLNGEKEKKRWKWVILALIQKIKKILKNY